MKTSLALVAALLLSPAAALAQDAEHAAAVQPAPAEAAAGPQTQAAHEAALRTAIAGLQSGTPDYSLFGEELSAAIREQSVAMTPGLQALGALSAIEAKGMQGPAYRFNATFENGVTGWTIRLAPDGKIEGLMVAEPHP